jgi:TonB family protein
VPATAGPPTGRPDVALDVQGSLDAARDLYAAADYQGALDMLDRLMAANPSPEDRQSIDLYRTFCLVALGRLGDADKTVTAMITRDPTYRPADSEVPPRLRSMFSDKRKEVLPSIIQLKYQRAKSAFDRNEYKAAAEGFKETLIALSDPDIADPAARSPLSDIRVLAIGFNDLAVRAMASQPVAPSEATTPPSPAQIAAVPPSPRIYDSNDQDVAPPVTIKQDIPRYPRPISAERVAELYVVIDETGRVESAIIGESLDRTYDRMLLTAAETWSYQPAKRSGVAVKYRKRIQLNLSRQTN